MHSSHNRSGFTLLELMVVVVITGVVSTALYQMLIVGQKSYDHTRVLVDTQPGLSGKVKDDRAGLACITATNHHGAAIRSHAFLVEGNRAGIGEVARANRDIALNGMLYDIV